MVPVLPDGPHSMEKSHSFRGQPHRHRVAAWRASMLDQVPTAGGHSRLPAAKLGESLGGIGEAIDAVGGSFTMPYATVVVTALRTVDA